MSYTATDARKFVGQSVGNGNGAAFARAAAALPAPAAWKRGAPVRGSALAPGTAIATFGKDGRHAARHGRPAHAAIYLGQSAAGIRVLDQWLRLAPHPDGGTAPRQVAVHERTIAFDAHANPVCDGRNYYVIE